MEMKKTTTFYRLQLIKNLNNNQQLKMKMNQNNKNLVV